MPSVCFYFQVHQPYRLASHSVVSMNETTEFFDDQKNGEVMKKVAEKCYLPTNAKILSLIKKYQGRFRVSYAITGVAIEQMQRYSPETLKSFQELAKTGCVEFIGETYYHSLSAVYDQEEFRFQVKKHSDLMESLFGQRPQVFRNTELIYSNEIGHMANDLGFKAVIAEGADDILAWRSPNYVYEVPRRFEGEQTPKLLLKNYRLSDDIAFRFSNQGWESYPLTADTFASWVHTVSGAGETVNLFMDYETFGEHQWASTGIFDFLEHLPEKIFAHPDWDFLTPSEVIRRYNAVAELPFHRLTSWADEDRDLTAWQGNNMQQVSLLRAFNLASYVRELESPEALDTWRKLLTSDHYYYMCTKWFADGDVHAYFSPYDSPYEAFINFMNAYKKFVAQYSIGQSVSDVLQQPSMHAPSQELAAFIASS